MRISKTHRRARVLPILTTLFATGAVLQLATGVGAALAQDPPIPAAPVLAAASTLPPSLHQETARQAAEIVMDIRAREEAIQNREEALEERETLILAAQERLRAQVDALETVERELAATMALADVAAEDDINRLVAVFEAMKPEEAAAVFAEMAPDFAAGFLGRLNAETAAAILAGLEPRQAYALSALLAGRNALVPQE